MMLVIASSVEPQNLPCRTGRRQRLQHRQDRYHFDARALARRASELGDDGTNDLAVSDVLRTNKLQVWFLSEHLVDAPLVKVK
jgi:hypothetical protein